MKPSKKFEKLFHDSCDFIADLKLYNETINSLEALYIIKEKRVSMVNIYHTDDVKEYNSALGTEVDLTEEEYNKIKELYSYDE